MRQENNRRLTFEYILLRGVNDQKEHVTSLRYYYADLNAYVNLIPYNAVDENGFQGVDHEQAMVFYDALMKQGIRCTIRKEHGADIDAACGQLRVKHLKKEQEGPFMSLRYFGTSHVGLRRRNNQDSICFLENKDHALLAVVCDGIGGGLAGDVASRIAIEHMKESFLKMDTLSNRMLK